MFLDAITDVGRIFEGEPRVPELDIIGINFAVQCVMPTSNVQLNPLVVAPVTGELPPSVFASPQGTAAVRDDQLVIFSNGLNTKPSPARQAPPRHQFRPSPTSNPHYHRGENVSEDKKTNLQFIFSLKVAGCMYLEVLQGEEGNLVKNEANLSYNSFYTPSYDLSLYSN